MMQLYVLIGKMFVKEPYIFKELMTNKADFQFRITHIFTPISLKQTISRFETKNNLVRFISFIAI